MNTPETTSRWTVLRLPGLRRLAAARLASLMGDLAFPVALAFLVLHNMDGSASTVGIVIGAQLAGMLLAVVVGGAIADKFNPVKVMVASDLTSAGIQAVLIGLYLSGRLTFPVLVGLVFCRGISAAFFSPASQAIRPRILPSEHRQAGNAVLSLAGSLAVVAGPVLGGVLVVGVGAVATIALDAASYLGSAALIARIRLPAPPSPTAAPNQGQPTEAAPGMAAMIAAGMREVRIRPWLMLTLGALLLMHLAGAGPLQTLMPVTADQWYGGAYAYAAMFTAVGIGSLLGGLVAAHLKTSRRLLWSLLVAVPTAATPLAMALRTPLPIVVATFVVVGLATAIHEVLWHTVMQEAIPTRALGRVSSLDTLLALVALPAGQVLGGFAADHIGLPTTLAIATIGLAAPILLVLAFPAVRREPPHVAQAD